MVEQEKGKRKEATFTLIFKVKFVIRQYIISIDLSVIHKLVTTKAELFFVKRQRTPCFYVFRQN